MPGTLSTDFTEFRIRRREAALLTPWFLVASYTSADGSKKQCEPFPLDEVLGNENGALTWGKKLFSEVTGFVKLEGTVLSTSMMNERCHWVNSRIDLDEHFGLHPEAKQIMALKVPAVFCIADKETVVALMAEPGMQQPSAFKASQLFSKGILEHLLTSFTFQDELLKLYPNGVYQPGMVPTFPDFDKTLSTSQTNRWVHEDANASSKTTGDGLVKVRVTKADASTTAFRIDKAGGKEVKIELVKTSVGGRAENFQVGDGIIPKYVGVEATISLLAVEGKAFKASAGLGMDFTIGIKDKSFDLKLFGIGFKVGTVMGISFMGSELSVDLEKVEYKSKMEELRSGKVHPVARNILFRHPVGWLIWLVT